MVDDFTQFVWDLDALAGWGMSIKEDIAFRERVLQDIATREQEGKARVDDPDFKRKLETELANYYLQKADYEDKTAPLRSALADVPRPL